MTPEAAREALADFIAHRLPSFGRFQDAMWGGEPWLFHSRISAAMNLKLLGPREVIAAAEIAWRQGKAELAAATPREIAASARVLRDSPAHA